MHRIILKILMIGILGAGLFICSAADVCLAQTAATATENEEKITIMTYYPSPLGVYSEMQLFPYDDPGDCNSITNGTIYMDTSYRIYVCNAALLQWVPLVGDSFWTQEGNNLFPINYADENVGIGGISAPAARVDVNGMVASDRLCIGFDAVTNACKSTWGTVPRCPAGQCLSMIDFGDPSVNYRCRPCGIIPPTPGPTPGVTPTPTPLPQPSPIPTPTPPGITWKQHGFISCTFKNPSCLQYNTATGGNMYTNTGTLIGWAFMYGPGNYGYCTSFTQKCATTAPCAKGLPACPVLISSTGTTSCTLPAGATFSYCCKDCYGAQSPPCPPGDPPMAGSSNFGNCSGAAVPQLCHGEIYRCSN